MCLCVCGVMFVVGENVCDIVECEMLVCVVIFDVVIYGFFFLLFIDL